MSVAIRVEGDAQIMRRLNPALTNPPMQRFLHRGAITVQGEMRRRVKVDTGRGRNSITYEISATQARIGTNLKYLEVMARGRRPGRAMPPPGVLLGWMRRHGIPADMELALRRSIGRKGIAADNFDKEAFKASVPKVEALVRLLNNDIVTTIGAA